MPFNTPTLAQLIKRATNDLQSDALRQSDSQVLARVLAAAVYGQYGYIRYVAQQILPDTADEQTLIRLANLRIGGRKGPAVARGNVQFTGTAGAMLPENTVMQTSDGRRYMTTAAVTLTDTAGTAEIISASAGEMYNLEAGETLTLISPVVSINDELTVLSPGISGGSDLEYIEDLRERVCRSYRVIPHGGCADDYVTWALEVEGVTRAWVIREYLGPGTVGVFCLRDGDDEIIPDSQELAAIKAHIEDERPVTADVYVLAPTLKPVPMTIKVTPDNSSVRTAVQSALENLFDSEAELGGTILISHIRAAISGAAGETDNIVISPTADITCEATEIATLGEISWSS